VTNEVDIRFNPWSADRGTELEDVMNLVDNLSKTGKKAVVVFDEFQEVFRIDKNLVRHLRSIMQAHQHCNYLFLGSQESMIREIFEKKKSPFYHFGLVMNLGKIPAGNLTGYLNDRFGRLTGKPDHIANKIIEITDSHPYYTQQLAFFTWEVLIKDPTDPEPIEKAVEELIQGQDLTYERLWGTLITSDRKIMIGLIQSRAQPLSADFGRVMDNMPASTIYSRLKKLVKEGYLLKTGSSYAIDDVFFALWLKRRLSF
jgi:hypothetical protein